MHILDRAKYHNNLRLSADLPNFMHLVTSVVFLLFFCIPIKEKNVNVLIVVSLRLIQLSLQRGIPYMCKFRFD